MSDNENSKMGQSEIKAVIIASISIALLLIVSSIAQDYIKKYMLEIGLVSTIVVVVILIYLLFNLSKKVVSTIDENLSKNEKLVEKKLNENKTSLKGIKHTLDNIQLDIRGDNSKIMPWNKLWSNIVDLTNKIEIDPEFQPDIIVGIGRSGAFVGSLIAGNLKALPFITIDRISDFEGPSGKRRIKIIPSLDNLHEEIRNKKILIVMSECDSGKTLLEVIEALSKIEGVVMEKIKTAVLFRGMKSEFLPDYYANIDTVESRQEFPFRTKNWPRTSRMPIPPC